MKTVGYFTLKKCRNVLYSFLKDHAQHLNTSKRWAICYTDTELQDFKFNAQTNNKLGSLNYTKRFIKDIFCKDKLLHRLS